MKKFFVLSVLLILVLSLVGCSSLGLKGRSSDEIERYAKKVEELEKEIDELKDEAEQNVEAETNQNQPAQTNAPTKTPTPTQTPIGMSDVPVGNPNMYSSYAHMVSYDPARGWADFDYFEMLVGPEAIDALVDYEGYNYADAQVEVNSWHEGAFYEKNTNSRTRTIDLKTTDIVLLITPDGLLVPDIANPPAVDVEDVFNLYNANTNYLYTYFFYYITVDGSGNVTKVEQIYRP